MNVSYLECDLVRDLIEKSKIMKHFVKSVKLEDIYQNYYNILVLRCFFLVWINPREIMTETIKHLLKYKYDEEKIDDVLKRMNAYKILYVDYKNDEDISFTKNVPTRKKYEDYEIYMDYKNWWDVMNIYMALDKFMSLLKNPSFYLKLSKLSVSITSKRNDVVIKNENHLKKLRKKNKLQNNYYFFLIFKCFIIQIYKWDKIFDDLCFYYVKKDLDKKIYDYLKDGFIENKLILELVENIDY